MNVNRLNLLVFIVALFFLATGCGGVNGTTRSQAPTPTPTPTPSPTPTPTPFPTPTPIVTPTPMATPTPGATPMFVFVGNTGSEQHNSGSIAGFRMNGDGSLTPVPGSPFKTDNGPTVVKSDPQGHFVFIGEAEQTPGVRNSNCFDNPSILLVERLDPTSGKLIQVDRVILRGSCVSDIAIDPSGKHLYVGVENDGTFGSGIQEFHIAPTGTLTEATGSPVIVEGLPVSLAMHPSGKFLYAATPNLTVLDRDTTTGALAVRGVFNTPKKKIALNAAGTFLVASERDTNEISQFIVDAGGNVTETFDDRQPANAPDSVGADPLGQFFAVTEFTDTANDGGLSTLKEDHPHAEYRKTNTVPFGNGHVPADVAFDPTGKFVYIAFFVDGTIQGFTLDRTTGNLTAVTAPIAIGDHPSSITIVQPR